MNIYINSEPEPDRADKSVDLRNLAYSAKEITKSNSESMKVVLDKYLKE